MMFNSALRTCARLLLLCGISTQLLLWAPAAHAAAGSEENEALRQVMAIVQSLKYQTGKVNIAGKKAQLSIAEGFRFLNAAQSQKVLEEVWGNPPDDQVLGMIFPASVGPIDEDSWAVVLTYQEDGYVSDADAGKLDFGAMLKEMQESAEEGNKERVAAHYPSIKLVGWAEPPHYDREAHKIFWAKELEFNQDPAHTLNYAVRVLGRQGVLEMNIVASMNQLDLIRQAAPSVISMAEFTPGNRYADFDPASDKVATYGLGALVLGGIAAKSGLFKVLIGILIASKKVIILALIAGAAMLKNLFKRRSATPASSAETNEHSAR